MKLFTTRKPRNGNFKPSQEMKQKVTAVEKILGYNFKDKRLLEEALTHSSCTNSASSHRLALLGDAALGLALTKHIFRAYPGIPQGLISLLRSANVSNEKLARVAVQHGLYGYVLRDAPALDDQVNGFTHEAVKEEEDETYDGSIKAPKVLADIVESVAAAMYIDMNFDLDKLWMKFNRLLEPKVTLEDLSASLGVKEKPLEGTPGIDGSFHIEKAKEKLHELCVKKKWGEPIYLLEKEEGPSHAKRFVSSVVIETNNGELCMTGDEKSRKGDAESSAASSMIRASQEFDSTSNTTKEYDYMMSDIPSLSTIRAMACWVIRLLVLFLKGIILLVILFVVAQLVIA